MNAVTSTTDPVREAEFNPDNVERVKDDVRQVLKRSKCIFPDALVEALANTVLEESLQTRRRMAFMVSAFTEVFGDELTADKMAKLEYVLLCHHRDEDNLGFMPEPPDGTELT